MQPGTFSQTSQRGRATPSNSKKLPRQPATRVIHAAALSGDGESLAGGPADKKVNCSLIVGQPLREPDQVAEIRRVGNRAESTEQACGSISLTHAHSHPSGCHATDAASIPEQTEPNLMMRPHAG